MFVVKVMGQSQTSVNDSHYATVLHGLVTKVSWWKIR